MRPLTKGQYTARIATTPQDIDRAQNVRHLCFITNRGLVTSATDADCFDDMSQHIVIEDAQSNTLVCCFRLMQFTSGTDIHASYSAQFYDLARLSLYSGPMAELGRFCIHPDHPNPDILRLAWGALTRIVDEAGIEMLFGCSSFDGSDPAPHQSALALLQKLHLAPAHWMPGVKSPQTYALAQARPTDPGAIIPPLLRSYLAMGGWVSDHAVIDRALNTLHVFTGLAIASIPANRARLLRAIAG